MNRPWRIMLIGLRDWAHGLMAHDDYWDCNGLPLTRQRRIYGDALRSSSAVFANYEDTDSR